jgi:hypothetical protein
MRDRRMLVERGHRALQQRAPAKLDELFRFFGAKTIASARSHNDRPCAHVAIL